jgi:hypothetical protein
MSDPVITMCPTMANPEAFTTVPELREELRRANDLVLEMGQRLHAMNTVAHQLGEVLSDLVLLHIAGKTEEVVALMNQIQAKHVRVVNKAPGGLH